MEFRLCASCRRIEGAGSLCPSCGGRLELAEPRAFVGQAFGKYSLECVLGAGGMGVVFGARHATLGRLVALKMILPGASGEAFQKRFLQEARVLAELKHPNIVEVYDFDVSDWGPPFMVMEFLEGRSLREILDRCKPPLPLSGYASLVSEAGAALAYAHKRGVVHRDLKPENIFVAVYDGVPVCKVLDFGLAKFLRASNPDDRLTATGAVMGTPHYLAPEQILCRPVSPQSDQYALALVVAELAAGKAVRAGKSFSEICATEVSRPLRDDWAPELLPGGPLRDALRKATDPDPSRRFQDVSAFVAALGLSRSSGALEKLASAARCESSVPTMDLTPPPALVSPPPRSSPKPVTRPAAPPPLSGAPGGQAGEHAAPRRAWAAAALVALLGVAAALVLLKWPPQWRFGKERTPAPYALLEKIASVPVPADATNIITRSQDKKVSIVGAPDGVYLVSEEGDPPARIPLGENEEVIAGGEDGVALLRVNDTIVLRSFLKDDDHLIAKGIPKGGSYWISPRWDFLAAGNSGSVEICRIEGQACKACGKISVSKESPRWILLGERHAAESSGDEISVYSLPECRLLWKKKMESGLSAGAIYEPGGLLAAGGWTSKVYILDLNTGAQRALFSREGHTNGLSFLPGGERLAVAGEGGLLLLPLDGKSKEAAFGGAEDSLQEVDFKGGVLAALDEDHHRLDLLGYHGMPELSSIAVGKRELWAMAADPMGRWIYAGGPEGSVNRISPKEGKAESFPLHTQGVTGIVASQNHVASSSDDRTIAVWAVPRMNVLWRSKAHDYLINGLCLSKAPMLWSSSSDGDIKAWNWPQLDEKEEISTTKLFGKPIPLAAIWASSDGKRVLCGTWTGKLLDLAKGDGPDWRAKLWDTESQCLYSAAEVPGVDAVVFGLLGGRPGVFVYDLREGRFFEAEALGAELGNAYVTSAGKDGEVCVAGSGVLLLYRFDRDPGGRLRYSVCCKADSALRSVGSATVLPDAGVVAAGSVGRIFLYPLASLRLVPPERRMAP